MPGISSTVLSDLNVFGRMPTGVNAEAPVASAKSARTNFIFQVPFNFYCRKIRFKCVPSIYFDKEREEAIDNNLDCNYRASVV